MSKGFSETNYVESTTTRPSLRGIDFNKMSHEDNLAFVCLISEEEIKKAIWSCDGNKSPSPNGFNLSFIEECWDIVTDDIAHFVNEFQSYFSVT